MQKEGDTQFTKMRKMATVRQQADRALETASTNPMMGKKELDLVEKIRGELADAVPFTVHDVNTLEQAKNPRATMRDVAEGFGLAGASKIKAGTIEDGYKFKGGDPADAKNWEKVQ